ARVYQYQVAVADLAAVLGVVQDAGVAPCGNNRGIGRGTAAVAHEGMLQLGLQLVLVHPRAAHLHGADVGFGGDIPGRLHDADFRRALVQAHVVQQVVQRHELLRRLGAHARLAADGVDPPSQAHIEFLVGAHGVIDPLSTLDQPRQNVIHVGNRKGIIGAVLSDRAVLAGAVAVPQLAFRILLPTEQHVLAMLAVRNQHCYRFRLGEAGQVLEIAVLAVGVFRVAVTDMDRGGWQDGDTVGFHLRHQRLAAAGIFLLADIHGLFSQCSDAGGWSGAWSVGWHSLNSSRTAMRTYSVTSMKSASLASDSSRSLCTWAMAAKSASTLSASSLSLPSRRTRPKPPRKPSHH